jgi:hypothetical protein
LLLDLTFDFDLAFDCSTFDDDLIFFVLTESAATELAACTSGKPPVGPHKNAINVNSNPIFFTSSPRWLRYI